MAASISYVPSLMPGWMDKLEAEKIIVARAPSPDYPPPKMLYSAASVRIRILPFETAGDA